ncbi:MAG: M6 family metalloprotease domain-containing protein [Alphaproteobacteria bacterium]
MSRARLNPFVALPAFLCVVFLLPAIVLAVPPRPALETLLQPDGTAIVVQQFGDEWSNGVRTRDGYTILRDERTRFWKYAEPDMAGGLRRSPFIVGRDRPVGIRPRLSLRPQRTSSETGSASQQAAPALSATASLGTQPLLVIFVDFTPSVRIGSTAATLYSKFYGASGSVKNYYETVSYGNFSFTPAPETNVTLSGLINDGIVSVTLPYAHPNTGSTVDDRNRTIVRDALLAADSYVDFSQFDTNGDGVISATELHLFVIVAGAERSYSSNPCGPSVWAHRWGLSGTVPAPTLDGKIVGRTYAQFGEWHCSGSASSGHAATIGVMIHELGHDIGLPDLYDMDDSSAGIGDWSVMASGSWNGVTLPGDSPAHFDPWSKFFEGWVSPTPVTATLVNQPIVRSATNADIYQLLSGTPSSGEYFLVENRQRVNYDAGLPGSGLLIWHIDASKANNSSECYPGGPSCVLSHYKVALVQADNQFDLEKYQNLGDAGDPWPGTTGNTTFNDSSAPSSKLYGGASSGISVSAISASAATMTATLGGVDTTPPDTLISGAPLAVTNLTTATFTFSATEANSSFACKLDSGVFAACTSPKNYSALVSGSHNFQVQATDLAGNTDPTPASYNWTIDVTAPDTSITGGPTGTISASSATFNWTGTDNLTAPGNLVYAYRLDPVEPNYSAFGSTTTVSYNNIANGNYTLYVKSRDQAGNEDPTPALEAFTVSVPGPLTIGTTSLPQGEVGVSYNVALGVGGGQLSYVIGTTSGALPGGLSVVGQNIVGIPTAAGRLRFTLKVTDQSGASVSRRYTLTINRAITISSSTLRSGTAGRSYRSTLKASGGNRSVNWSWLSGLVPGLSLSPNGQITGTPTAPGVYDLTFQVADSLGGSAQKTLSLTIR